MGDGGVACVPTQHVVERYTFCGGGNNGTTTSSNKFNSKSSLKLMKMKVNKKEAFSKVSERIGSKNSRKEVVVDSNGYISSKEEVEEGEFGSFENGEFVPENKLPPRRFEIKSEIEKGEFLVDRWRKGGGGGEAERWRKGDLCKLEFSSGRLDKLSRRGEVDKTEPTAASWRGLKEEVEKGEFIPDRWRGGRSEVAERDDSSYSKMRRHDSVIKDKGWKCERGRTPPSGKYSGEKDFNRNGGQFLKKFSRWEGGNSQDRMPRINSKIVDEEGSLKNDFGNGKNHGRDYPLGNRLKRHGAESDISDRKQHGDFSDYTTPSKSRRLSEDGSRAAFADHSYRNSLSTRNTPSDRYSSRNCESPLPSRAVHDRHNSSPRHSERSPLDRARYHDHRERSPVRRDKSPYARSRHYDYRNQSPSYSEWSPSDHGRYHERRDQTPSLLESPTPSRVKPSNYRESNRKSALNEKRQSHHGSKGEGQKLSQRDPSGKERDLSTENPEDRSNLDKSGGSVEKSTNQIPLKEEQSHSSSVNSESPLVNGTTEDLASMEEDMDICDTPPHIPHVPPVLAVADSTPGKWFYLDHSGVRQGPSRLSDLKLLVEEGFLVSDHLIKHLDSDRWVTVEHAVSPLVTANFPSIFSDAVTQLVSPPEAPGNVLADVGDVILSPNQLGDENPALLPEPTASVAVSESPEVLHIDERVGALFDGFTTIPGRELEAVGEVLQMTFEHGEWERLINSEGFISHQPHMIDHNDKKEGDGVSSCADFSSNEPVESWSSGAALFDKDHSYDCDETCDWFAGRWSCKGGDWKRVDETAPDKGWRKKYVLNDGYALCQMPNSGQEDPRWHRKDELYYPSHSRRLDLPAWAFSSLDESNDYNSGSRSNQIKYFGARGVKGTMLPVIRINTCVVKDHGSFVSESRKSRGKDRYSSRSNRHYTSTCDSKRSSEEGVSRSVNINEQDSQASWKSIAPPSIPEDRLSTADDLQLHFGDWYYLDGAGHEQGPLSFSELQILADQGIIQKHTSVFRKFDKIWVPVTSATEASGAAGKNHSENNVTSTDPPAASTLKVGEASLSSFHSLHPQFIGYTRGKLHELIMKSYKSREFAAAINEVLDPWINVRQPRKEIEKHVYSSAISNKYLRSDQVRATKRARVAADGTEEECEVEEGIPLVQKDEYFDDLCGDATFCKVENADSEIEASGWGLLDGLVLARVFHFLRADIKSLVYAALTCKLWKSVVKFYKDVSRQADLSAVAPNCTDSMILNIMNGYNKEKITSLVLRGCTNITSTTLEDILQLLPCISSIDIRGCSQFEDLACRFSNIVWVKSRGINSKLKSIKLMTDRTYDGRDSQLDDSSGLRDYFESQDKRDSANQLFRRSLYKRSKVFDARKSSSLLSRGAQLRRLAIKKSENGYKRMKEFLALGLKDIMKENTVQFFVPKVAEIEDRMKNGYYAARGLSSVKEDISRMCRDAIKAKNRGDTRDMNRIVTLFIRLATSLEGSSKFSYERDEIMRTWKDDSPPGFCSSSSKYKKPTRVAERKSMNRTNGSLGNGGNDYGEYVSDREIRRRLSKLNKKSMGSGSETSDDQDRSSEETETDSDSSSSGTDTDVDRRSDAGVGESRGDSNSTADDGFDSTADDREWGARMTKASLVPPVTRKYEVIERYVIVADEEEVQRKMRVTLPEDYAEKLIAQKNGIEESDMEIPEVKDYKPRKQLGDEVIEQEVYGIDPYTHNLLLDSMPDESDWPLLDKHLFIEDVLLRALNKQARNFTGTGNTPMVYSLQPIVKEILKTAEEEHDTRTAKLCQFMLNAIGNRPEDNYVAYRKGLGVVCNKEGGFAEEDFVVEFLGEVYPAWKWFEKQDGIRSLQKDSKDPAPEFYNIYLERPKGDGDGYDLVVVDAMHKANYASRICHSCRPNCEAKVTAVDGQYQIGVYSVRPIGFGEEVTFDYNSVTESKEEYEASVCLCGSQVCRGSYLNLTGEGAYQKVLRDSHGLLNRHQLMLEACELNSVSEEDYIELGRAGLGSCLLGGLPDWLIAYAARLVRFINFERTKLPEEILRHTLEEKRKYFTDICLDVEKSDAEIQAEGVYNQRLQNLALTLDKVRYVMRCVFGDPKKAPPLLERLSPEKAVSFIWKGEGSFVEELIQCIAPHMEDRTLNDLRCNIRAHDPSGSDDIQRELRNSLIWLRDEVRNLPCTYKCRHDAAADLIHIYAFTKSFFRIREYKAVTSPPVYISPLDMGPKFSEKLGPGFHEYRKTYGENYCLGQLIFWHNQAYAEPDGNLARAGRGCLSLPDIGSFYAKVQKPSRQRVYGPRTVKSMLTRMEKQPQRPWPKDKIWSYKSSPKVLGSPMLDAVLRNAPLDKELVHWLKHRPPIFQAMWDR